MHFLPTCIIITPSSPTWKANMEPVCKNKGLQYLRHVYIVSLLTYSHHNYIKFILVYRLFECTNGQTRFQVLKTTTTIYNKAEDHIKMTVLCSWYLEQDVIHVRVARLTPNPQPLAIQFALSFAYFPAKEDSSVTLNPLQPDRRGPFGRKLYIQW